MRVSNFLYSITVFITLLCVQSCSNGNASVSEKESNTVDNSKSELTKQEYVESIKNNTDISRIKKLGELEYTLSYCPAELLALKEIDGKNDSGLYKEACEHYQDMQYFDFRIKNVNGIGELIKTGVKDTKEYTDRVTYCSFGIQKDFALLVNGKDSVPCGLLHFERAYDVAPEVRFIVAFPKANVNLKNEITFIFNDNLFNMGIVKFTFDKNSLLNLPKLKV